MDNTARQDAASPDAAPTSTSDPEHSSPERTAAAQPLTNIKVTINADKNISTTKNIVRKSGAKRQGTGMITNNAVIGRTKVKQDVKDGLTMEERDIVRDQLIHFMKNHPVKHEASYAPQDYESGIPFVGGILLRTFVLAVFFVVIAGVMSFAARNAVPGDMLYSFKVQMMEPFMNMFGL